MTLSNGIPLSPTTEGYCLSEMDEKIFLKKSLPSNITLVLVILKFIKKTETDVRHEQHKAAQSQYCYQSRPVGTCPFLTTYEMVQTRLKRTLTCHQHLNQLVQKLPTAFASLHLSQERNQRHNFLAKNDKQDKQYNPITHKLLKKSWPRPYASQET